MKNNEKSLWKPVIGNIMTRWAKDVSLETPLPEYPRPQFRRTEWMNLNGLWDYAIRPKKQKSIDTFDGKILVPFPIESALSGVMKKLGSKKRLWYQRSFTIPESWKGQELYLHFGAVDWETTVWINRQEIGSHRGGFIPFSFEISKHVKNEENEILISIWDPTNKGSQGRGKQTLRPFGIFYNAVSGFWKTVWLEPVQVTHIENLKMLPDIDKKILHLKVNVCDIRSGDKINLEIKELDKIIISISGDAHENFILSIPEPKLWSPDSPFLYDLNIKLIRDNIILDEVESYFGMRKIGINKDTNGIPRIELNNKPIFQYGTLDQGYWPDGLYTAPTDEALKYDIETTKKLGFNLIRKHGKVEPARWYYYCDKLGILVWQDMPSGGKLFYFGRHNKNVKKDYYNELESMISALFNSPSVIIWVPFNEGWGQFETKKVTKWIKNYDPFRLVDNASGWFDKKVGDLRDIHKYPGPKIPKIEKSRACVLGEFGGLGFKVENHIWHSKFKWSYKRFKDLQKLSKSYTNLITELKSLIKKGLCAAIFTQITDVEGEINGLLTYDREVMKIDEQQVRELNLSLFNP